MEQGYAYILTHPGTPSVFYDHLFEKPLEGVVRELVAFRKNAGLHCRSKLEIHKADRDCYVAEVDDKVLVKLGPGDVNVDSAIWSKALSGSNWAVWERR